MSKMTSYTKGMWAEYMAVALLTCKGYRILKHRYKTRFGEIDIIAKRGNIIAFIEVKSRKREGDALEAVQPKTQRRIENAAKDFISHNSQVCGNSLFRFDVITVTKAFTIKHLDNAWVSPSY